MLDLLRFAFFLAGGIVVGTAAWFTLKSRVAQLEAALAVEQETRKAAELMIDRAMREQAASADRAMREHIESAESRLRTQVNGLGARVKKIEEADAEIRGHFDELREHVDGRHERSLEREALVRERVARLEGDRGIPLTGDSV